MDRNGQSETGGGIKTCRKPSTAGKIVKWEFRPATARGNDRWRRWTSRRKENIVTNLVIESKDYASVC